MRFVFEMWPYIIMGKSEIDAGIVNATIDKKILFLGIICQDDISKRPRTGEINELFFSGKGYKFVCKQLETAQFTVTPMWHSLNNDHYCLTYLEITAVGKFINEMLPQKSLKQA